METLVTIILIKFAYFLLGLCNLCDWLICKKLSEIKRNLFKKGLYTPFSISFSLIIIFFSAWDYIYLDRFCEDVRYIREVQEMYGKENSNPHNYFGYYLVDLEDVLFDDVLKDFDDVLKDYKQNIGNKIMLKNLPEYAGNNQEINAFCKVYKNIQNIYFPKMFFKENSNELDAEKINEYNNLLKDTLQDLRLFNKNIAFKYLLLENVLTYFLALSKINLFFITILFVIKIYVGHELKNSTIDENITFYQYIKACVKSRNNNFK